jgi:Dna[CI] antecedent, DciA
MRGIRSLSDILCELIAKRGYGRLLAREMLENAWNTAIGRTYYRQTQVGEIRRGVLNVTVAHSSLLEELAAFRKAMLLAALQSSDLGKEIRDIQFQVGPVEFDINEVNESFLAVTEMVMPCVLCPPSQKESFRSEKQT